MIRSSYYCDGCGRKLEGESLQASTEFTATVPGRNEIFCPERCMGLAPEYFSVSQSVIAKILTDADKAISNYRRKFFASRQLKEVAGGV